MLYMYNMYTSDANFILINWLKPKGREKNIYSALIQAAPSTCTPHSVTKHLFTVM